MGSKWDKVSIDALKSTNRYSCVGGPFGSSLSRKHYEESGVPVIRGVNLSGDEFKDSDFVYVSVEKGESLSRNLAYPGDLVFTQRGTLGQVALIPEDALFPQYVVSQSQMKLSVNPDVADAYFLYLYFRTKATKKRIEKSAIVGGVPHINLGILKGFEVELPPLPIQKKISALCMGFDKKITLNNQINQTLEQMAQTLFKSWFVDFDPVIDNALDVGNAIPEELEVRAECRKTIRESKDFKPLPDYVRKLFPNEFDESELGWVPKGWLASSTGEELSVKGGSTPSTKNADFWDDGDINWTSPKDLSDNASKIMLETSRKITEEGLAKITSGLLPNETVLMSSRAPVGYLALTKIPVAINQGYIAIPTSKRLSQEYVLYWLDFNMDTIKGLSGGTTFAEISKKTFKAIDMLVPDVSVVEAFSHSVRVYLNKISSNVEESKKLIEVRDSLLPQLLSGELEVSHSGNR